MPPFEYVSLKEAAETLGVDRSTVQRWVRRGNIDASRLGTGPWLILRSDLDQLVTERRRLLTARLNSIASVEEEVAS